MNIEADIKYGERAKALLDNEVYKDAMLSVRNAILIAWEQSPIRDKEGHNELKLMLKLLNDLQRNIIKAANDGKLAAKQLEIERQKGPRIWFKR